MMFLLKIDYRDEGKANGVPEIARNWSPATDRRNLI